MKILGIDPGSTRVGYGLIEKKQAQLKFVKAGLLKIISKNKNQRLIELEKSFSRLLKQFKPNLIAIEELYFMKNQKTALEVAQSRGILMLIAAKNNFPLIEIAPSKIKLSVAGDGRASKKAVAKMVSHFLKTDITQQIDDATDALAIAIAAERIFHFNNSSYS